MIQDKRKVLYDTEPGEGAGKGYNLNLPMARGTGYADWGLALQKALARIGADAPDVLVVSLGLIPTAL